MFQSNHKLQTILVQSYILNTHVLVNEEEHAMYSTAAAVQKLVKHACLRNLTYLSNPSDYTPYTS